MKLRIGRLLALARVLGSLCARVCAAGEGAGVTGNREPRRGKVSRPAAVRMGLAV